VAFRRSLDQVFHQNVTDVERNGRLRPAFACTGLHAGVEVHVSNGLPGFTIVGLPDAAVHEFRDRVRAAMLSIGLPRPLRRLAVASPLRVGNLVATDELGR
jgi:hypothetical protein